MEGFGQTETTLTVATMPWMEPKPGSMGLPNPQYDVDLIDHEGRSVEAGEQGQIVIRTSKGKPIGLFKEYYRDAERTREAWHDGIYYTGDVAWKDEDGYLWFVGRADDVIKSSGYRIGPFEVESALMTHPAVVECAITGVPDEIRGQVVKATIVLSKDYKARASEELIKELQNHVKKVTAPYKYPRVIEFVDELPKTISGSRIVNKGICHFIKRYYRLLRYWLFSPNIIQNNIVAFTKLPRSTGFRGEINIIKTDIRSCINNKADFRLHINIGERQAIHGHFLNTFDITNLFYIRTCNITYTNIPENRSTFANRFHF